MKLFTIGDSISQGFMSLAAARTDLSYSSLIAEAMGIPAKDYRYPDWPLGGHPINLELLFRRIENLAGPSVNLLEWPLVLDKVNRFIDEIEDFYERGPRAPDQPVAAPAAFFHNIAIRGYDVADAWLVTPKLCERQIAKEKKLFFNDGIFALPSASFYRTALDVLNPSRADKYADFTALRWLEEHHKNEGVENLILWLGSNNALGTVVDMKIKATNAVNSSYRPDLGQVERADFNLWSPEHFAAEFATLLEQVVAIMKSGKKNTDWHVFIGTVPAVTIAPLAKGVGDELIMDDPFQVLKKGAKYYKYYTYVLFEEDFAKTSDLKITRKEAYAIDEYIAAYNNSIKALVKKANAALGKDRIHVVPINEALLTAAYKRNDERPTYKFPDEVKARFPLVDTRFYHADTNGLVRQGGIFSLDGVHPSAIGQGLLAHEFLKVIGTVRKKTFKVNWDKVYREDTLFNTPIRLMHWVRAQSELVKLVVNFTRFLGKMPESRG